MARIFALLSLLAVSAGPLCGFPPAPRAEAPVSAVSSTAASDNAALTALTPLRLGRVVTVVDGDTVVLADGESVRLVGLQAPKLPLDRPDFRAWPLADEAKATLGRLVLGREVTLAAGGREGDRHDRILAHIFDAETGLWVQGAMLSAGMARVYSFPDNRALVAEMLAREAAARQAGRGIWGHPYYALRRPEETQDLIGSFQVVEGRVLAAAIVRGRSFLNFGEDWREDFTASLAPPVTRSFQDQGIDPRDYEGRRLRLRGWVTSYDGPRIDITHPEQIEVLQ